MRLVSARPEQTQIPTETIAPPCGRDLVSMLAYAVSGLERLAALNAAIANMSNQPRIASLVAHVARELADDMTDVLADFQRECEALPAPTRRKKKREVRK